MPNIIVNRKILEQSSNRTSFTPATLNADMYYDATGMDFFTSNSYGTTTTFYNATIWENKSTVSGALDATQGSVLKVDLKRQEIGGYNALWFGNGYYSVTRYSAINYQYNQNFYIAFSIRARETGSKNFIDSRNSATSKGGLYVGLYSGKLRFGMADNTSGDSVVVETVNSINDNLSHTVVIQNTTGNAFGVSIIVDGVTQSLTIITNNATTDIAVSGNPLQIGTNNAGSQNPAVALGVLVMSVGVINRQDIRSFNDYCIKFVSWNPIRYASNPVIAGFVGQATDQSYPPFVWKEGSTYYAMAESGNPICSWSSTDGKTFTQQNVIITNGTAGQFDDAYIYQPIIRKESSTYYLFYGARQGTVYPYTQGSVGLATSTSPISGYTKQGQFFTVADYNAVFNSNMDGIILADIIKISGTYYWFGIASDVSRFEIFYGTSSSITTKPTPQAVLIKGIDIDKQLNLIQRPNIFKTFWGWAMTYTSGFQGEDMQERNVRSAYCTTTLPTSFTPVNEYVASPLSSAIGSSTWENKRVYTDMFLKNIDDGSYQDLIQVDGYYRQYSSGHNLLTDSPANQGYSGLFEYKDIPDLRKGRVVDTTITFNANASVAAIPNCLAWVDASDNCFYDINNLVWQINNKANKYAPLTSSDTFRPTYVASGINSLPVMRFGGTQIMQFGKGLGTPASWTQIIVLNQTTAATQMLIAGDANAAGSNNSLFNLVSITADGRIRGVIGNGTNITLTQTNAGVFVDNTPTVIMVTYQNGDLFLNNYKNGVFQAGTTVVSDISSIGSFIGNMGLGGAGAYSQKVIGDIAEYLMYSRVLTAGEMSTVTTYLRTKYNI